MNKSIAIVAILFLSTISFGQTLSNFGLKIGYGISNQDWVYRDFDVETKWDDYSSFAAAAFYDYPVAPFLDIEMEIGYIQKGLKFTAPVSSFDNPDGTGEYIQINNSLNYFNFSALAKLKYDFNLLTPYIIAGPELNYMFSKDTHPGMDEIFNKYKKSQVSFSLGAGTEINMKILNLLVEYRYSKDLTNSYDEWLSIKNYSHKLCAGIKF